MFSGQSRGLAEPEGKQQRTSQLEDGPLGYQKFLGKSQAWITRSLRQARPSFRPNGSGNNFQFPKPAYLAIELLQSGRGMGWKVQIKAQGYQMRLKENSERLTTSFRF